MNIRELIKNNNISQGQLAKMLSVSRIAVNHWVSEKRKPRGSIIKLIKLLQDKKELK